MDARPPSSDPSPWMPFESRRRARDEKRDAVLRTAVQLFLDQGYHRATLTEVAERLNITKPALYNYFRSKEEILFECWAIGQERVDGFIAEINAGGGSGLVKLRKLVHAYAETMTDDYGASLVRFDPRDLSENNSNIVRAAKRTIDRTFRKYISDGIADGSIKPCDRQDDRVRHRRIAELDRSLVQARRRDVGGSHRRTIRPPTHRGTGGRTNEIANQEEGAKPRKKRIIAEGNSMNTTQGLRRALQINPDGLATVFGDRRRNWREVGERVSRLAAGLRALGANPGERVAVLSLNSDRYLELYLATAWAGAVIVPLNIRWSAIENQDALADCRAVVLVVDKAFAATGAALAKAVPGLKLVYADDGDVPAGMEGYEALLARSEPIPDAMRGGADLAGIFYTGGTTGRSKGVMLSHGNLMANALNALGEGLFAGTATYIHAAPMFHLANGAAMYSLLLSGGSNVIIQSFTPEGMMAAVQNNRVTDVLLVPTMIQMLVDHPALGNYDMSSLTHVVYGASPISEAVLGRAMAALPHAQFTQAYGMTELSPIATLLHWNQHIGEGRAKGRHRGAGAADARLRSPDRRCRRPAAAAWVASARSWRAATMS